MKPLTTPQDVLTMAEALTTAYAQETTRVNSDPRFNIDFRRKELQAIHQRAAEKMKELQGDFATAIEDGRRAARRDAVGGASGGNEVRAALSEIDRGGELTPERFNQLRDQADTLGDKHLATALRYRALDNQQLASLLTDTDRTLVQKAYQFESEWGKLASGDARFLWKIVLSTPAPVAAKNPEPAKEQNFAFGTGGGQFR